jgi:hypothetical protein
MNAFPSRYVVFDTETTTHFFNHSRPTQELTSGSTEVTGGLFEVPAPCRFPRMAVRDTEIEESTLGVRS